MKVTSEDLKSLFQESTARPAEGRTDCLTAQTMMSAATGQLSDEERERIADHMVTCSDCAWEYRFVLAHKPWADQAGQAFAAAAPGGPHPHHTATRPAFWQQIVAPLRRNPVAIAAQLLLLVLLALGGWMILTRQERLNEQLTKRDQDLDSANKSLAEMRRQLEDAIRRLNLEQTGKSPKQYEEEIARLRQTIDELTGPQLDIPIIDLDTIRSGGTDPAMPIEIPRNASSVTLILNFNDRQQHPVYEVEIFDQRNDKIWRGQSKSHSNKLPMTLPRRFLPGGRYLIRLFGLRNNQKVPVADYAIIVSYK
jgi:cell division protein FtsB